MAVIGGPDERLLHAQIAQVRLHVEVELAFQVHEEADLGFVTVLRRSRPLIALEARNEHVVLDRGLLAQFLQLFRSEVGFQPRVVDAVQLVRVELRRRIVALSDPVLIEDLDDGDGRLITVFRFSVRVDVRQQVVGVLLLQLDDALVEEREALGPLQAVGIRHAIALFVRASDVEIEVHVDAVLLELGHQEVEPVELLRIEGAGIVLAAVGNAGGRPLVDEMQADNVDAVTRQGAGPHRRVFLGGKLDRSRTPIGEVNAPESDTLPVGLHEVSALDANVAVLTGRSIVEKRYVGGRRCGVAMVDYIWLEQAVVPLDLCEAGEGEEHRSSDYRDTGAK
jgi:hypothetical protein